MGIIASPRAEPLNRGAAPVLGAPVGDAESALASSLRMDDDGNRFVDRIRTRNMFRGASRAFLRGRKLAADVAALVEARLPGGVCQLEVRSEPGEIVLRGTVRSYYVKQVAQTVAMAALGDERLVNEIEVHAVR